MGRDKSSFTIIRNAWIPGTYYFRFTIVLIIFFIRLVILCLNNGFGRWLEALRHWDRIGSFMLLLQPRLDGSKYRYLTLMYVLE